MSKEQKYPNGLLSTHLGHRLIDQPGLSNLHVTCMWLYIHIYNIYIDTYTHIY